VAAASGSNSVAASVAALLVTATPLAAQDISINFGQSAAGGGLNERIIQLIALFTVLSLAPSILIMMTSFTLIVVMLSLLRTALGTATAPPNSVVISLSLFLTAFVMGPVLTKAYNVDVKPLVANESASTRRSSAPPGRCAASWTCRVKRRRKAPTTCQCASSSPPS
jgi:flagellar biosynthesis protein FliP